MVADLEPMSFIPVTSFQGGFIKGMTLEELEQHKKGTILEFQPIRNFIKRFV